MDRGQMIKQRAKAVQALGWNEYAWTQCAEWVHGVCLRIASAELEREGRLVEAMKKAQREAYVSCQTGAWITLEESLRAYEAEFAPPQRTVEQIARDVVDARPCNYSKFIAALDELSAALKRGGE